MCCRERLFTATGPGVAQHLPVGPSSPVGFHSRICAGIGGQPLQAVYTSEGLNSQSLCRAPSHAAECLARVWTAAAAAQAAACSWRG